MPTRQEHTAISEASIDHNIKNSKQ